MARPNHLVWDVYALRIDVDLKDLTLQPEEVAEARWVDEATFRRMLRSGELFSYPEIEEMLLKALTLADV